MKVCFLPGIATRVCHASFNDATFDALIVVSDENWRFQMSPRDVSQSSLGSAVNCCTENAGIGVTPWIDADAVV